MDHRGLTGSRASAGTASDHSGFYAWPFLESAILRRRQHSHKLLPHHLLALSKAPVSFQHKLGCSFDVGLSARRDEIESLSQVPDYQLRPSPRATVFDSS